MITIRTTVVEEDKTAVYNMPVLVMTQEDATLIDGVFKSTISVFESNKTWMDLSDSRQALLEGQIKILSKLIEDLEGRVRNLENKSARLRGLEKKDG